MTDHSKCWEGCEKLDIEILRMGSFTLVNTVCISQTAQHRGEISPCNSPSLVYYSRNGNICSDRTCTWMFPEVLFIITTKDKTISMFNERKSNVVYQYSRMDSVIRTYVHVILWMNFGIKWKKPDIRLCMNPFIGHFQSR